MKQVSFGLDYSLFENWALFESYVIALDHFQEI